MNWACDRKDRQLPGNDQPHSRLTGTIPRCRPTQLTARYAAIHAKKWIGDDPSVYDNSQQQQQQQYTQRRADAEIPENLGSKPKHEIGGDLVEEVAHSDFNFGCVLGDSNFGKSPALRRRLRKQSIPYALEFVPSKFPVVNGETPLQEESESGSSDPDETHWEIPKDAEIFSPEDLAQEVEDRNTDREWEHLDWAEGTEKTLSGNTVSACVL